MDIKLFFDAIEHRDAFVTKWALEVPEHTDLSIEVPWHLVHHALKDEKINAIEQLDTETEHQFIVNGEKEKIEDHSTITKDLGNGWFVVSTVNGVQLGKNVSSIEVTDTPVTFVENVVAIDEPLPESNEEIDPTDVRSQWPRIRTISRFRPLLPVYAKHELKYQSKPELYVMDSGINFNHDEFDVEGLEKQDFFALDVFNKNYSDDLGHGTAVAAMAVGKNLGITNHATLLNVKIGGLIDGVLRIPTLLELGEAIDTILAEAIANPAKSRIVNMSWTVPKSPWLESKVLNLINAGITVIAAAGNGRISVDDISPAGIPEVITVGAVDKYDIPAGFNNISPSDSGLTTSDGLALDLFAPGDNVVVANGLTDNKYTIASGTSLAAPIVAGVALEIAALNTGPVLEPYLKNLIISTSTEDALLFEDDRFSSNQNRLIHLLTGDELSVYKSTDAVSYLGVHEDSSPITGDLNSSLDIEKVKTLFPNETTTFSIEVDQDSLDYIEYITIDEETGIFTIEKPDVAFADDSKLKMVKFVGVLENSKIKMTTNPIFFFDINPDYDSGDIETDVTLALTEINSISFFSSWGGFFIK